MNPDLVPESRRLTLPSVTRQLVIVPPGQLPQLGPLPGHMPRLGRATLLIVALTAIAIAALLLALTT